MKKLKTILLSLIIVIASACLSACSCSGGGSNENGVNTVNVSGISISSDHDRVEVDEETKYLTIRVRKGEEFNITYNLAPTNTTTTQVNWEYIGKENIVNPKRNYYTYAQGATHTIAFVAKEVGNTIVKFSTIKGTNFSTQATIIVGQPMANLPTFLAPVNIDYNPTTGKITWDPVTRAKLINGTEVDMLTSTGSVSGLRGYEVRVKNLTTGNDLEPEFVSKCEYELPRGITYMVSIVTKGDDNETVKDSQVSTAFRFHQLASVSDLKNDNGTLTFTTPAYSSENRVFYKKDNTQDYLTYTLEENKTCTVNSSRFGELNNYDVYVLSFPAGYGKGDFVDKNYVENPNTHIRYYANIADTKNALHIEKLEAPTINLVNKVGSQTLSTSGGTITFNELTNQSTKISWGIDKSYEDSLYGVRFKYVLKKNDVILKTQIEPYTPNISCEFDLSSIWQTQTNNDNNYKGNYSITISTIGLSSSTIASESVTFDFAILDKMKPCGQEDNATSFVVDDYCSSYNSSEAYANIGGADLYFVYMQDNGDSTYTAIQNKSKYVFIETSLLYNTNKISGYNLNDLNLESGLYEVYGKYVGKIGASGESSATGEIVKINGSTMLQVSNAVQKIEMTSDGIIKFSPVSHMSVDTPNYDNAEYEIIVTRIVGIDKQSFSEIIVNSIDFDNPTSIEGYDSSKIYRSVKNNYLYAKYTQIIDSGITYNYISIKDVIAKMLVTVNYVAVENVATTLEEYLAGGQIEVTIRRKGIQNETIDAPKAKSIKFNKAKSITNATLNYYILQFDSIGDVTLNYLISITDNNGIQHYGKVAGKAEGSQITLDLKKAIETTQNGGSITNAKTLSEYVNKNDNTIIGFTTIGSKATQGNNGTIDSTTVEISFGYTATATNISASQDGTITWDLPNSHGNTTYGDTVKVEFHFAYDAESNGVYSAIDKAYSAEANVLSESAEGETSSEGTSDTKKYAYNISNWIDEIYSELGGNYNLEFTIDLLISYEFTGTSSDRYYIVKLPSTTLVKSESDGVPSIEFNKLTFTENIKYSIVINKNGEEKYNKEVIFETSETGNIIVRKLSDFRDDTDSAVIAGVGNYSISIIASKEFSGDMNGTNPYVIGSTPATLKIIILGNQINATGNGTNIKWKSINENATYTVKYKKSSDSDYTYITEEIDGETLNKVFTTADAINGIFTYDVSTLFIDAGEYQVKVEPSANYLDAGILFASSEVVASKIIKLNKPSSINTNNGVLEIKLLKLTEGTDFKVSILVSDTIDGEYSQISEDMFVLTMGEDSIDESDPNIIYSVLKVIITGSQYEGAKYYKVGVSTTGALDSEYSDSYQATKICSPANLNKIDEWIEWGVVANASAYDLYTIKVGDATSTVISIGYDSGNNIAVKVDDAWTNVDNNGNLIIKIENDKIYYKFDEASIINGVAGDHEIKVIAYTTTSGYLNSSFSVPLTIHKLSNELTTSVNGENFEITTYTGTTDANSCDYTINKVEITNEIVSVKTGVDDNGNPTYEDQEVQKLIYLGTYSGSIAYEEFKSNLADGGKIAINLNNITLQKTNDNGTISTGTIPADAGLYSISLQIMGDNNSLLHSDIVSTTENIEKLDTTTPYVENGTLAWKAIDGASEYTLRIASGMGESATETIVPGITNTIITESELAEKTEGFLFNPNELYQVSLMAGNTGCFSSLWSDNFTVKKLLAPVDLKIVAESGEPMLTWNNPNLNGNNLNLLMDFGTPEDATDDTMIYSVGDGSVISGQLLNKNYIIGNYDIRLRTLGSNRIGASDQLVVDGIAYDIVNGKVSLTRTYSITTDEDGETEIVVIDGVKYNVTTNGAGDSGEIKTIEFDGNTYTIVERSVSIIREYIITDGMTTIDGEQYTIIKGGVGLLNSDWSDEGYIDAEGNSVTPVKTVANFVKNPENIRVSNNVYTWDAVAGALAYKLSFYQGLESLENLVFTTFTGTNSYNFIDSNFAGAGYYKLVVEAITNPQISIISTNADVLAETANNTAIYRSPMVTNLMVKDGMLAWTLKVADIVDYLTPFYSSAQATSLMTALEISNIDSQEKFINTAINEVLKKVNDEQVANEPTEADSVLYNLYNFHINLNGVKNTLVPMSAKVVDMSYNSLNGYTEANVISGFSSNTDNRYILFRYNMSTSNVNSTAVSVNPAGKYVISIASAGNMTGTNLRVGTTDSNYCYELTVYKPLAPTSWTNVEGSKQISNGNLLWTLVSKAGSSISGSDGLEFHENYKITASAGESIIPIVYDYTSTKVGSSNPNLTDNSNYSQHLKNLFVTEPGYTNSIGVNTTYQLHMNVVGTVDSRSFLVVNIDDVQYKVINNMLYKSTDNSAYTGLYSIENGKVVIGNNQYTITTSEDLYLNSDLFAYSDKINFLSNTNSKVINSTFDWDACEDSTKTLVYIYGPFNDTFDSDTTDGIDDKTLVLDTYLNGGNLHNFKNAINDNTFGYAEYYKAGMNSLEGSLSNLSEKYRHVLTFPKEEIINDETGEVDYARITELTISGNSSYSAGTYIIRTQEIGNGRGIIDTIFTENLFVNGANESDQGREPSYGLIARKLGTTSMVDGATTWLNNGTFAWKAVDGANAYKVVVNKINKEDNSKELSSEYIVRGTSFEIPDNPAYTAEFNYSLSITAVNIDANDNISPNYFNGETIETDDYGRLAVPVGVSITGEGQLVWNISDSSTDVEGYKVYVNDAEDNQVYESIKIGTLSGSLDLGTVSIPVGLIKVNIKSIGSESILNSAHSTPIQVQKIANPNPRVTMGVFEWGTTSAGVSGENQTTTNFSINSTETQNLGIDVTNYRLYNEVKEINGENITDENKMQALFERNNYSDTEYLSGEYAFSVKFNGDIGSVSADEIQTAPFKISSNTMTLTATKLNIPTLSHVDFSADNMTDNRIKWTKVDNASGYRVVVFEQITQNNQLKYGMKEYLSTDTEHADWFEEIVVGEIVFNIQNVITEIGDVAKEGLGLRIYVQAIGTLDSLNLEPTETIYINSGYSSVLTIKIPAQPETVTYDANTGKLSWTLKSGEENYNFNVLLTTTYQVNGVTKAEFEDENGYWKTSANIIINATTVIEEKNSSASYIPYDEIKKRTISYVYNSDTETYDLTVTDIILLEQAGTTPTEYYVTNIATNYQFTVIFTVGDDVAYGGDYQSIAYSIGNSAGENLVFNGFAGGDGSDKNPYKIDSEARLQKIGNYLNKNFVLTNDLILENNWKIIKGKFTGTLDGDGYSIINVLMSSNNKDYTVVSDEYNTSYILMAFMNENAGTIKNLNMQIKYNASGSMSNYSVYVAGLAIINSGTIDNVNIITNDSVISTINVDLKSNLVVKVSGLVVKNTGEVTNSSVEVGENGTAISTTNVNNKGIYVIQGNNQVASKVAGIIVDNQGTITESHFSGDMTGNFAGGVVSNNYGIIDKCYSTGNVCLTDAYLSTNELGYALNENFGGLASITYDNSQITNSYAQMKVVLNRKSSNQVYLGGLVGQIKISNEPNNIAIKNSYAVVDFVFASNEENTNNGTLWANALYNISNIKSITTENIYYLEISAGTTEKPKITLRNENETNACADLAELNTKVRTLIDDEGNIVFVIDETNIDYPTLA